MRRRSTVAAAVALLWLLAVLIEPGAPEEEEGDYDDIDVAGCSLRPVRLLGQNPTGGSGNNSSSSSLTLSRCVGHCGDDNAVGGGDCLPSATAVRLLQVLPPTPHKCGADLINGETRVLVERFMLILGLIKDWPFVHDYNGKLEIRRKHHQHNSKALFLASMLFSSQCVDRTRGQSPHKQTS